jgi:hypothetical protein
MEKLAAAGVGQRPVIFICHRYCTAGIHMWACVLKSYCAVGVAEPATGSAVRFLFCGALPACLFAGQPSLWVQHCPVRTVSLVL